MKTSNNELEKLAEEFRSSVNANKPEDKVNPLNIRLENVKVITVDDIDGVPKRTKKHLLNSASKEWSAMSVPLDMDYKEWIILRNESHNIERQMVSLLEEFWHILMGHLLVRIIKIGDKYGRTYDKEEEDQAYYLAAATLTPKEAVANFVERRENIEDFAKNYGVSPELVRYRIKRLGLWYKYRFNERRVSLKNT